MRRVVKKTNVILLQRMKNLGQIGDVVSVRVGYARNYLIPQGIALRATEKNIEYYNSRKDYYAEQNKKQRMEAEVIADKLRNYEFILIRTASENGSLYGSVSRKGISDEIAKLSFNISSQQVELRHQIKEIGYFVVPVHVHPDVTVDIFVNVARTKDDAARQSKAYKKQQNDSVSDKKVPSEEESNKKTETSSDNK